MSGVAAVEFAIPDTATAADAGLLRRVAEALRPKARTRPSAWAEANVTLSARQGAEVTGPYRCAHYPWLAAFHDALFDRPGKRGVAVKKPSQKGITLAMLNVMACACATEEGSVLYIIGRADDSKYMVSSRWDPIVRACPGLAESFRRGAAEARSVLLERPFEGGQIDFVGAGSASAVSSRTYRRVIVDEFDESLAQFPSEFGDLHEFVQGRMGAVLTGSEIWCFAHPTRAHVGIDHVWRTYSDRGRWVFSCPHCGGVVAPHSGMIDFRRAGSDGRQDPESAALPCPGCARDITDSQRQRAVWPAAQGGSGRLEPETRGHDATPYVGFAVNGLCDPYKPLRFFAEKLALAPSGRPRQSVLNVHFGEEYQERQEAVTAETVRGALRPAETIVLPGGELGACVLTTGADVQAPRGNPTVYTAAAAFDRRGMMFVVALQRCMGFAAWHELHRRLALEAQGTGLMAPSWGAVDARWETGQVLDACRVPVYSERVSGRVRFVPVQFEASMHADQPVREVPKEKQYHPTRPDLGPLERYYLHRHTCVDRIMQRLVHGRIVFLCQTPPELAAHLTANVLTPRRVRHTWQDEGMEWEKIDDRSDDWLMALVYAEMAAVIRCGLDRLHLAGTPGPARGDGPVVQVPRWGREW